MADAKLKKKVVLLTDVERERRVARRQYYSCRRDGLTVDCNFVLWKLRNYELN